VDDLLDVARIASGKLRVECEPLDLTAMVRAVVEDRRGGPEASAVTVELKVPDGPVWVSGDRARLTQVVGNLLTNGLKFTDPGGRVTVRLDLPAETAWAAVTVADNGIGIAPDVLPRVFDTFAQDERGAGHSRGGLGLGLALVKGLVELHGGGVAARSDGPGRGTTIHCWLPLAESAPRPAAPTVPPPAGGRRRVLVVDDDADSADTLCVLLGRMGHETAAAYSGPAALEAVQRFRPDVVLCDLDLPGMDGCAVVRALRANPLTARLRLIAVSGYGQEEDRRQSLLAGFDCHLTKPVDPEEWERILADHPKADGRKPS
jgi:CheY-like chemotaxis protein